MVWEIGQKKGSSKSSVSSRRMHNCDMLWELLCSRSGRSVWRIRSQGRRSRRRSGNVPLPRDTLRLEAIEVGGVDGLIIIMVLSGREGRNGGRDHLHLFDGALETEARCQSEWQVHPTILAGSQ